MAAEGSTVAVIERTWAHAARPEACGAAGVLFCVAARRRWCIDGCGGAVCHDRTCVGSTDVWRVRHLRLSYEPIRDSHQRIRPATSTEDRVERVRGRSGHSVLREHANQLFAAATRVV